MIRADYHPELQKAVLNFSGTHFYELLEECRSAYLEWNADLKAWTGSPKKVLTLCEQLNKYEPVMIDPLLHDASVVKPETVTTRASVDESIFRVPYIKGKGEHFYYQRDAAFKLARQNRAALFLGMGTGKTFINISALNYLQLNNKIEKVLIICPTETLYNWREELKMFSLNQYSDEDFYIADVNNRSPFESNCKFIIMTYRTFLMLCDDEYKRIHGVKSTKYKKFPFDLSGWGSMQTRCIILDESHCIKNPSARQSKLIMMAREYFYYRYILTGTPTPNEFGEIYNQIKFLDSSLVPETHLDFLRDVAVLGTRFSPVAVRFYKPLKVAQYEKAFQHLVVRIRAEDAVELPELIIQDTYCGLTGLHKEIYQAFTSFVLNAIVHKEGSLVPSKVKNSFAYISQALDNPELLRGKLATIDETGAVNQTSVVLQKLINSFKFSQHGKLPYTEAILEKSIEEEHRKVILFDFHPKTIDSLAVHFSKYNPLVLHGQLDVKNQAEERERIIQEFKKDSSRKLLIASSMVLKVGVNLPEATRVIYFSRTYSYLDYSQSIKRAHRIGQTDTVIAYPLIFTNSLDMIQDQMLKDKDTLDKNIFSKKSLTDSQWKAIFNGNVSLGVKSGE